MLLNIFNGKDETMTCLIFLTVSILIFKLIDYFYLKPQRVIEEKRKQEQEKYSVLKEIQDKFDRKNDLAGIFGVRLGNTMQSQNYAYNEIVRSVNLLTFTVSEACVKQDKANRGLGGTKGQFDIEVRGLKENWSFLRDVAIKINPKLKDRMPHFSEFEPLKSYNAEHLLKKKAKSK